VTRGWLERLKNSAGIQLSHKKNSAMARRMPKNLARRLRGLVAPSGGEKYRIEQMQTIRHMLRHPVKWYTVKPKICVCH